MPNVYVVHLKDFDVSRAAAYGTLIPMFTGKINIFNVTALAFQVKEKLKDYKKEDYLLLTGNLVLSALAVAAVVQNFKTANLLVFDIKRNEYLPRTLADSHLDMGRS